MKFPLDKYKKENYWFHFLGQIKTELVTLEVWVRRQLAANQQMNQLLIPASYPRQSSLSSNRDLFQRRRPHLASNRLDKGLVPISAILTILTILYIDHIDHHPSDICVNDCTADYLSQQPDQQDCLIISWPDLWQCELE